MTGSPDRKIWAVLFFQNASLGNPLKFEMIIDILCHASKFWRAGPPACLQDFRHKAWRTGQRAGRTAIVPLRRSPFGKGMASPHQSCPTPKESLRDRGPFPVGIPSGREKLASATKGEGHVFTLTFSGVLRMGGSTMGGASNRKNASNHITRVG